MGKFEDFRPIVVGRLFTPSFLITLPYTSLFIRTSYYARDLSTHLPPR